MKTRTKLPLKSPSPSSGVINRRQTQACFPERCPVKEVMNYLSGAWTVEIYWNLQNQAHRFGELRRLLGGVSPKVLTERLRALEAQGVIERQVLPTSPPQVEYSLTELGQGFLPILETMAKVGGKLLAHKDRGSAAL